MGGPARSLVFRVDLLCGTPELKMEDSLSKRDQISPERKEMSPKAQGKMKESHEPASTPKASMSAMTLPITVLASLLKLQDVEDHKPRLSKISWLPDVLVWRGSIIPTVLGPVLSVTFFSACVAVASKIYGKEVGLTNNVVPLLSVVVALLLVFRNTTAYERFAEGRKDFTTLISNARNLSRNVWIVVTLPPANPSAPDAKPPISRARLTEEKKRLIRLIVAFAVSTKHHLRAEGGVHHDDLKGLLPASMTGAGMNHLHRAGIIHDDCGASPRSGQPLIDSPSQVDEESLLGFRPTSPPSGGGMTSTTSLPQFPTSNGSGGSGTGFKSAFARLRNNNRAPLKRRPTAVRVAEDHYDHTSHRERSSPRMIRASPSERTPLIKPGVKPDIRYTATGEEQRAEVGLGRMVELGLPLIIAHEISRTIFRFRRMGCLEAVGPAGMNAMQALVQSMTDQLSSMERIVQTPLPVIFGVHLKQTVTIFLFILPFTLVDLLGWKMVFIVTAIAFTMMGVEHIAAQVEMPFGTDACDLNLDLYCTELLCECEAILERLPEGDEDDFEPFTRSDLQRADDYGADDDGAGDGDAE